MGKHIKNAWKKARRLRMPRAFVRPDERIDITDLFLDGPPVVYDIDKAYIEHGKDVAPSEVKLNET